MKVLLFVVFVSALCFIDSAFATEDEPCFFDPQAACNKCEYDNNFVEYVGNACNCSEFYQCQKNPRTSEIIYHKQVCSPCTCFSDKTWGCTNPGPGECDEEKQTERLEIFPNGECYRNGNLAKAGTGTFQQKYQQVRDSTEVDLWVAYYMNTDGLHVKLPCPPGTYFDLPACQCLACDGSQTYCAGDDSNVFCFDFPGGEKGISYSLGPGCDTVQTPGSLNLRGTCNLEVPFFKKNDFGQFTFCAEFNRRSWTTFSGEQGIIFNGGPPGSDCNPGSIRIVSTDANSIQGAIITGDGEFIVSGSASASNWHQVCLRYTGSRLDLVVDGTVQTSIPATGRTKSNNCNLLVGQSWDTSGIARFFDGQLTHVCFYNTAIDLNPLPS